MCVRSPAFVLVALLAITLQLSAKSILTVAGGGTDDGRPATAAGLNRPYRVVFDGAGNLYVAQTENHRIRKIAAGTGIISTVAGNGAEGFSGDGGPAIEASLANPFGIALDGAGNLYIADAKNSRVRKVDAATGIISTIAGNGTRDFAGDGGPAIAASLVFPTDVVFDAAGNLYIADSSDDRIRRVAAGDGIITTFAGNGMRAFNGDGGPATSASFRSPSSLAIDGDGNLFIADERNNRIRRVATNGIVSTVAGNGIEGFSGDGGAATAAALNRPDGITFDVAGNLYIADFSNNRIRKVAAASGIISTVAGNGADDFSGDGGPATAASLSGPVDVILDASGNLYIADTFNNRIRIVDAASGTITTIAGRGFPFTGDGGLAINAALREPSGVAVDAAGNLYIADRDDFRIRRVAAGSGIISTVAGTGELGFEGDGGLATAAELSFPEGLAVDAGGNLLIADTSNDQIRRVDAGTGIISTIAGGVAGFSGDNGPATSASLTNPADIALDRDGNLYIADRLNNRIRRVDAASGIITTIAGSGPRFQGGFSGDGGPATAALLDNPSGVALDGDGNLYIADTFNNRIRRVDAVTGIISTFAGNGTFTFAGDGGPATAASLRFPEGVAVDGARNLYIADRSSHRIRRVDAASGIITTVAGNGVEGFAGDNGPATAGSIANPSGAAVDGAGNLFIADTNTGRIRAVLACVTVNAPALMSPATNATGIATAPMLTWSRVAGAFRYDLYLSTANPPDLIATDLTSTTFAPSNLTAGVAYFWRVVAKGDPFCVPRSTATSEIRSFTTRAACTSPAAFTISQPADGATAVPQAGALTWQAAAGAGTYDLYFGPASPPPLLSSGLSSTSFAISNLASATRYFWSVVAHASCDSSKVTSTATASFLTEGECLGAGAFTQRSPADGATVPATTTLEWTASSNAPSYDLYLGTNATPSAYLLDIKSTTVTVSGLIPSRQYFWRVVARNPCDESRNQSTPAQSFTIAGVCPVPGSTVITFVPPASVGIGQTYTVAWSDAAGLDADGGYIVERSLSPSFGSLVDSQETFSTSASFVATIAGTYYHRVRAIAGCNPSINGPYSDARPVTVVAGSANVIFTVQPQAVFSPLNDKLEDKRSRFTLENIGPTTVQVILGKSEVNSVPFFTIVDPFGGDPVFVTLEPRKPKTFEIRFSGPPNDRAASYQGMIFATSRDLDLAVTPYAFVNLKVGGAPGLRPVFLSNGRPVESIFFPGFSGDDRNRPPITIDIRNEGTSPMELAAEIGPEVWLVPESGWNATPIAPGATRPVRLSTQRNRAPNGSALPRYTYFTVRTAGGEVARLLVQDNDALSTAAGRTSLLDPGSRSYLIPGVTTAPEGTFTRLRLTNVGSEPVQADLFFTPAGADGFDAGAVKRASALVPPNDAVTLTDPLAQVFGLTPPAAGQIEVRAASERVGFILASASVATPAADGGAYTYTLPAFRLGEGARLGTSHLISGVFAGPGVRSALTVTETSGTEHTAVRAVLIDSEGNRRGESLLEIPRYGERSIDVAALSGGSAIDGARIELTVEAGGGSIGGFVTMLDSDRNGGATAVSEPSTGAAISSVFARRGSRSSGENNSTSLLAIVPVVMRGPAPNNPNVILKTAMGFSISGLAGATTVVTYRPNTPGAAPIQRTIEVSPRLVLKFDDVLTDLFGLPTTGRVEGSIFIEGLPGAQIFGRLLASTGTGGAARVVASLPLFSNLSEVLSSLKSRRPLYLDGLEQSIDNARGTSWAVRINETGGAAGTIRLRLYEAGNRSQPIAEKSFAIASNGQLDLDTVFRAVDLDTEARRKDRTNVLCVATVESGSAVISAVGIATDNRTGDLQHVVFSPTGGVPATGVLKVSLVTSRDTPPPPAESPRRRAVRH